MWPQTPLLPAVRQALPAAAGQVALRLAAAGPLTGTPHRRRAARALLQDAAQAGGGQVFETAAGDLLLLAVAAPAAERAAAILAQLGAHVGAETPPETWALPADNARLLEWAAEARLSPRPPQGPAAPASGLAELDTLLDTLPLHRVVRREAVLWLAAGEPAGLGACRLKISRAALRLEIGALAADLDLLRHAEDRIAGRLAGASLVGMAAGAASLLVPLPLHDPRGLAQRGPGDGPNGAPQSTSKGPIGGTIAVLPLAAAAAPAALAERRAALAAAGRGLALSGLDAAALRLVAPAELAADLLLLRWSPALTDRAATAAVRGALAAERLVLTACDGPEAMAWGRAVGIRRFAGPQVAALLAAARLAACPAAAGCNRRQCADRAAATDAAGRNGCANPALLAALLPEFGT